MLVFLFIEQAF